MRSLFSTLAAVSIATGGRGDPRPEPGPTSSAAEIPALASLLVKGQWTPTPELSGRYNVGTIIDQSRGDHRIVAASCFARPPVVSPYIGAELVAQMQSGVSMRLGVGSGSVEGELVKKVKFGTPTTESLESLYLKLKPECETGLNDQDPERLAQMYVVQEVLKAEIAEQSCGRIDASGRVVGLGAADMEYSAACSQETLEPVVVGYRTLPLVDVLRQGETRDRVMAVVGASPTPAAAPRAPVAAAAPVAPPAPTAPPASAQTRSTPPKATVEVDGSGESPHHFGAFIGTQTGLRYRYHFSDGRMSIGLRAEGGLLWAPDCSIDSCIWTWTAGGGASVEFEHRRSADRLIGAQWHLGAGYPGYVFAGGAAVVGRPTGPRLEVGAGVGYYAFPVRASVGWIW
jgi:hypothetical protein